MRLRAAGAVAALLLGAASVSAARADEADGLVGRWLTRDADGVFQIMHCGDRLCGRLVGMRYNGPMPLDVDHRPQCDEMLLSGFRPTDEPGHWHGSIRDPSSGNSYQATIWLADRDILKLRGYMLLPILGETQQWSRFHGMIGVACKF